MKLQGASGLGFRVSLQMYKHAPACEGGRGSSMTLRSMCPNGICFGRKVFPAQVRWEQSIDYLCTWTLRVDAFHCCGRFRAFFLDFAGQQTGPNISNSAQPKPYTVLGKTL